MKSSLFGTSGIRGVVNIDYHIDLPLTVGLAIATLTIDRFLYYSKKGQYSRCWME